MSQYLNCNIPLVSIIINNYNYGKFLHKAIDSALKQTYSCVEVIVVDDGSTDNSREVIDGYQDAIIPILKENRGQASAINAGFAASKGIIICLLDADDVFVSEKVSEIVEVFHTYEDIGWCFHRLRFVEAASGAFLSLSRESSSKECDFRSYIKRGKNPPFTPPATSGLCFKRSLLQQILPMPEARSVIISDLYLKTAAVALSKGYFLDKQLSLLHIHENNVYSFKDNQTLKAEIAISTAYGLRKNYPFMAKYTDNMFLKGIDYFFRYQNCQNDCKKMIVNYLQNISPLERIYIKMILYYKRLKYKIDTNIKCE